MEDPELPKGMYSALLPILPSPKGRDFKVNILLQLKNSSVSSATTVTWFPTHLFFLWLTTHFVNWIILRLQHAFSSKMFPSEFTQSPPQAEFASLENCRSCELQPELVPGVRLSWGLTHTWTLWCVRRVEHTLQLFPEHGINQVFLLHLASNFPQNYRKI